MKTTGSYLYLVQDYFTYSVPQLTAQNGQTKLVFRPGEVMFDYDHTMFTRIREGKFAVKITIRCLNTIMPPRDFIVPKPETIKIVQSAPDVHILLRNVVIPKPKFAPKAWFWIRGYNGLPLFAACINQRGSSTMRIFDVKAGHAIGTRPGTGFTYQQKFAKYIYGVGARELLNIPQVNLARDCKERLPDYVLKALVAQVRDLLAQDTQNNNAPPTAGECK